MLYSFIHSFQSEWLKKKRSLFSWLVVIGGFFTPAIILIAKIVRYSNLPAQNVAGDFWETQWKNSWESMATILLPLGIILAVSLMTQLEFKNNTWKQLHTLPQRLTTIFFAKFAVVIVMMVQFFMLFNIGIYLSAVLPGILIRGVPYPQEAIPVMFFLNENIKYFTTCLPVIAIQYLVSLQFKNYLVPVGGGLSLWVVGLAVTSWKYGYIFPYAYCSLTFLESVGRLHQSINLQYLALDYFIVFMIIGYLLYIKKKEKG